MKNDIEFESGLIDLLKKHDMVIDYPIQGVSIACFAGEPVRFTVSYAGVPSGSVDNWRERMEGV